MFTNTLTSRLHVIVNHDTDSGFKKEQCISFWGMPGRYYVREIEGISFIVLDGNDKGSPTSKGGYPAYVNAEQTQWLKEQIQQIKGPMVIVSHQPLAGTMAVYNATEIQDILSTASDKILIAINGHTHIDSLLKIKGINYVHINSASYFWVGSQFKHDSYSAEIRQSHPWISSTCPYQDSLFTMMTIDPHKGTITLKGRKTEWVGQSPKELGFNDKIPLTIDQGIVPFIRERHIKKPKA